MSAKVTPKKKQGSRTVSARAHFRSIILQDEKNLSRYASKDKDAIRKAPLSFDCMRPNYWRDSDRILHSFAYNRFLDKTQVFYLNENVRLTHRMLHVQLVSKISRLLAKSLRLNANLCEAIALGHDIGHAPFGHEGERILSILSQERLGRYFKHSVQSVRFLNILEKNSQPEQSPNNGMNLSLQVLDGILCHDGENLKQSIYPDRKKTIDQFKEEYKRKAVEKPCFLHPMTLEGCLVRFCDVIAYIGRDMEDAIAVGVIDRIPENSLGETNSQIIDSLVFDLLKNSEGKDAISYSKKTFEALKELYDFNMKNIYTNELINLNNEKIERLFRMMFEEFLKDLTNNAFNSSIYKEHVLPTLEYYPDYYVPDDPKSGTRPEQVVLDYIAGMTDRYFVNSVSEMFFPRSFPISYSDLTQMTGLPETYLDLVIKRRQK